MSKPPLVSVIVPTKNSAGFLEACLESIKNQNYENLELIVVDNLSHDDTPAVAKRYTNKFYSKGPERSAQRNYGVNQSQGDYVAIIDSDMELAEGVIKECVQAIESDKDTKAVIIPEKSFGEGFWAACKKLERSFYVGVDWIEAARFFDRSLYQQLGGYNEAMVSGEDWDLSQRVAAVSKTARIPSYIMHNEGRLKLTQTLRKKYYYAQKFAAYIGNNQQTENVSSQTSPLTRYKLFFSRPGQLFRNPVVGTGMLFMKTTEFAVGAAGYLKSRIRKNA